MGLLHIPDGDEPGSLQLLLFSVDRRRDEARGEETDTEKQSSGWKLSEALVTFGLRAFSTNGGEIDVGDRREGREKKGVRDACHAPIVRSAPMEPT